MALATLLITHGRDQQWEIGRALARRWEDAVRSGLDRAGAPYAGDIPVRFAFYGDLWRRDAVRGERGSGDEMLTELQAAVAGALLGEDAGLGAGERSAWSTVTSIAATLAKKLGVDQIVLEWFLKDLDQYLSDEAVRARTNERLFHAAAGIDTDIVLLGHSMGSIVAYLSLLEGRPEFARVRRFVTFGSPLGMPAIYEHVKKIAPGTPFPAQPTRWANVFNTEDFATLVPRLAGMFTATDGRVIEDVEAVGREPGPFDPGVGHDPFIYLTSLGLANELFDMTRGYWAGAAEAPKVAAEPAAEESAAEPAAEESAAEAPMMAAEESAAASAAPPRERGFAMAAPPLEESIALGLPPTPTLEIERGAAAPEAGAAAGPAPALRHVERTASADFPPVVAPSVEHRLVFAIAMQAAYARASRIQFDVPQNMRSVDLRVGVYAPDFDVCAEDGSDRTWMDVQLDVEDPAQRIDGSFRLTARAVKGRTAATIYLTIYKGALPVGQLGLETWIDPAYVAPAASMNLSFSAAPDPDYVFAITDLSTGMKGEGPFDIRVSREGRYFDKPLGQFQVTTNVCQNARGIIEDFRGIQKNKTTEQRIRRAQALGKSLWEQLPPQFQAFYLAELEGRPASIAIYSQEPYFPYELIVPERSDGRETKQLGVEHSIARWAQGRNFPDPLRVSTFAVIAPDYSPPNTLPQAAQEAADLVQEFGAKILGGDLDSVTTLLDEGGVQVMHFAGHGSFNPDSVDDSAILLSDGELNPPDVCDSAIGKTDKPFVFLNACQVGDLGLGLTDIGGWADTFCRAGFSGFVGPYWQVHDNVARKAARLFYEALRDGMTVGEATRSLRRRFADDDEFPGDTTWLAYTLHCQPNVHVQLPEVAPKAGAGVPVTAPAREPETHP